MGRPASPTSLPACADRRWHDGAVTIGILHPGSMGSAIGGLLGDAVWAGDGRSAATANRAAKAGMHDLVSRVAFVDASDMIISVVPPSAAASVADEVASAGFRGIYVDANAISPATAVGIGARFESFVDGGIVGPPPHEAGTTRLYLSGGDAADVARQFDGTALEARVIGTSPGTASALKMCFAAWTKGTSALLLAVRSAAAILGVEHELMLEWAESQPGLEDRSLATATGVGPKAWRFAPEMREIAATFAESGLPAGFHEASSEIFERLADFKDRATPEAASVIAALGATDRDG